ncbi:MAG: FHA domain-containing protein [Thermoleophilaceae bacterium]
MLYQLVLSDGSRIPLSGQMTIGRARESDVRLDDPSVSRLHARLSANGGAPEIEDAGSRYGTWVDGRRLSGRAPLGDGARLRVGDQQLVIERVRSDAEAGRTIVVPEGASAFMPAAAANASASTRFGTRPRVRSGYALKRLEAGEGPRRWVLKDLESGSFVRMSEDDVRLLRLIDGTRSLADLVRESEQALGPEGPVVLARLLAGLGEHRLLSGSGGPLEPEARSGLARLFTPRTRTWQGAGDLFARLYERGGWRLFTRPVLTSLAVLAAVGPLVFAYLVIGRYGTPFVVASKVGIGGLVFVACRLAVAAVHETAHGLTMASFGRRVSTAGLKLVLIFPYAFVDTSDAWFEPRRRRIAVSAAGPVSDFSLGAAFSLFALVLPAGTLRDIFFQVAFAAYIGGLFNLNPFLERDGYHMLVDLLGEPTLRRRAREDFRQRLSGNAHGRASPVLVRYSLFGLAWSAVAGLFAIGMSFRYEPRLAAVVPGPLTWLVLAVIWLGLLSPVLVAVSGPLLERRRRREA